MKKSGKLACTRGEFKHSYWYFAETPNVAWIGRLFEKIYYREAIFTVFSNIGEDIQYRCFN